MNSLPDTMRKDGDAEMLDALQYLSFRMNGEEYGVDIMTVREIRGWTETTHLPRTPAYMRGVINLRGLVVPIFDLRARFLHQLTEANASHVVIILAVAGRHIGMLVDAVSDILTVGREEVKSTSDISSAIADDYLAGMLTLEDRMVVLLSVERLFASVLSQLDPIQAA